MSKPEESSGLEHTTTQERRGCSIVIVRKSEKLLLLGIYNRRGWYSLPIGWLSIVRASEVSYWLRELLCSAHSHLLQNLGGEDRMPAMYHHHHNLM